MKPLRHTWQHNYILYHDTLLKAWHKLKAWNNISIVNQRSYKSLMFLYTNVLEENRPVF